MTIAIVLENEEWESPEWVRDQIIGDLPGVDIRCGAATAPDDDIEYLVCDRLSPGTANLFPNLKVIHKLGAGVDTIVSDATLSPDVRIVRMRGDAAAREISEYAMYFVIREQRHMRQYSAQQKSGRWAQYTPTRNTDKTIAVLGLGHIGGLIARRFVDLDFCVLGWSRSLKTIDGVTCFAGNDALPKVLGQADYVVSILPSTPETRELMNATSLSWFKEGSVLINVGRGDLVIDEDLLAALSSGRPVRAILDVFNQEPLPADHPYWDHPGVDVTPHVSGWNVLDSMQDIAENYRRMKAGESLLNEVDRTAGY